jgi:hypothetical protein
MAQSSLLENSYKRAEELVALNDYEGAVEVLHDAIVNKRKDSSTQIYERIMVRYS